MSLKELASEFFAAIFGTPGSPKVCHRSIVRQMLHWISGALSISFKVQQMLLMSVRFQKQNIYQFGQS